MQQNQISSLFIPHILPFKNLPPTLPTMQLDHRQFGGKYGGIMLVAANVAWLEADSIDITWGNLSDFPQLPLEPQQAQYNSFFTHAVVLPNTWFQRL